MDLGTELGSAGSMPRNLFDKLEAEWRQSCDSGEMLDYAVLHVLPPAAEGSDSGQHATAAGTDTSAAGLLASAAAEEGASIDNRGAAASSVAAPADSAPAGETAHVAEPQQPLVARQSLTDCRTAGPAADAGAARDAGKDSPEAAPSPVLVAGPESGSASAQPRARENPSCSPALLQVQNQDTGLHGGLGPAAESCGAASAAELQQKMQEEQPAAPQSPAGDRQHGDVHSEPQVQYGSPAADAAAAEAEPNVPAGRASTQEAVLSVQPSEHAEGPDSKMSSAKDPSLEQAVCPDAKQLVRPQEPRNSGRSPAVGNGRRAKSPVNKTPSRAGGPGSVVGGRQSLNAWRRAGEPLGTQPFDAASGDWGSQLIFDFWSDAGVAGTPFVSATVRVDAL